MVIRKAAEMNISYTAVKRAIRDNSMSIVLLNLFLICLIGQGLSGWLTYDHMLKDGHFPEIALSSYLATGNFLDGILSNWQAAILQLAILIPLGTVSHQKGAAHSRKTERPSQDSVTWKLGLRPTLHEWLYANSLTIAFLGMFVVTFMLHGLFGSWKYNESQALRHLPLMPLGTYVSSSSFWFSNFECWEAEFLAITLYIVLSIFLRQEDSPEFQAGERKQ